MIHTEPSASPLMILRSFSFVMIGVLHLNSEVSAILGSSIITRAERYEIMKMGQTANCLKQLL